MSTYYIAILCVVFVVIGIVLYGLAALIDHESDEEINDNIRR